MIHADGKKFLLQGKNYGYAMCVTETGFLQHLHYGGKITEADLQYLIGIGKSTAPDPADVNKDMALNLMPGEFGFYAHGDFREPTAVFERTDGATVSRLRYENYSIKQGAPALQGLPHVRSGGETLIVTLKDDFSDIAVDLYYTVYDDSDVLVRNAVIRNTGKERVMLKKAFSFRVDLSGGNFKMLRLGGNWARERIPEIAPIAHGVTKLQSLYGCTSHMTNCFMGILKEHCTEECGECFGVQLIYSGSFALTAEWRKDAPLTLQGGIADIGFGWELCGGEAFTTPQALLTYSDEGLGGMSRSIHDFIRERIVNPASAFRRRPLLVNNWEATYFDFNNEKLFPIIDEAAKLGIDTFVLDDGWFGKRDSDWSGLGDWFVNEKKLKGGLKTVIDRCKQNGLKFGLWFEPEMVNEDSELYRAHPDWAIHKEGAELCRSRQQLVLDFTRKEVVDYVFGVVSKILKENDISYVKWDMNRNITENYSASLPAHRQGEFMHRYILGVYDLAERLTSAFPNVFFEGCAGGGARFDAGMLYFFPQIWTSDDTDGFERTKIQWGTSVCYPLSAMSCHVSVCPNHQTGRTTPFETRGNVASLGAFGYELDLSKMTDEEKELTKKQVNNYKRTEELILKGDLYRLMNPLEQNYFCEMVVSKDKTEAYVVGERILGIPCDYNQYVYLRGLDEERLYHIEELDITASGKALANAGLLLPKLRDFGSWAWHLKKVK